MADIHQIVNASAEAEFSPELGPHSHGKSRVRVAKVRRSPDGYQEISEFTVAVQIEGATQDSFTKGDNSMVISTDTCKNNVYWLAKKHDLCSIETFGVALCQQFFDEYPFVTAVILHIKEHIWDRLSINGKPHNHGFTANEGNHECNIVWKREKSQPAVTSSITNFKVMKTTMSGWESFYKDKLTTLPETNERILATEVRATWTYQNLNRNLKYTDIKTKVKQAMWTGFFGDPVTGTYSKGVQETMFKMGAEVLKIVPEIKEISFELPNIHYLPCNIPVYSKHQIKFEHDVYIPTDEPHGLIRAVVRRATAKL